MMEGIMTAAQLNLFGEEITIDCNKRKDKTVISASRRTDIPAFFYEWLQDALKRGEVKVPNPVFPQKAYIVDLKPQNIHTIVLWSKNYKNVLNNPMYLDDYNLYFQYTINNYSKYLEPNVPDYKDTIHILCGLLKRYKPEQFNIRFDPIIISTKGEPIPTYGEPHKARLIMFEQLCRDLKSIGMEGCRLTASYISLYPHVKRKIDQSKLDMISLNEEEQVSFFKCLEEIAEKYKFDLYTCASPILEKVSGIRKGRCIDAELLVSLFGGSISKIKDKGQRPECGCCPSKDIGSYDKKCKFMCNYCYVIGN